MTSTAIVRVGEFRPSLAEDAKRFGLRTVRTEYPPGNAGVRISLEKISQFIREGAIAPTMRQFAEMVVRQAGVPASEQITDSKAAQILLDYVRNNVRYRPDQNNVEWTQTGAISLCVPGAQVCIPVGDCLSEGTLLLRDDYAFVPVEEIRPGDKVWGRDKWTTVRAKAFKGKLEVDAVEMNNGSTMYLTGGHKVYAGRCRHGRGPECPTCPPNEQREMFERVSVSDLEEGQVLLQPDKIDFGTQSPDPDRMYVEGLALADGWVHDHPTRFHIAGRDGMRKEAQKHEVKAICEKLGIETRWHRRYITVKDPEWSLRIAQLGSRARFKHFESIDLAEASAEAALRGVMADSTPNSGGRPGGRTYSTTSPTLMVQVRVLHRMFGRSTSVKMLTPEQHRGAGKHPLWRVGVREPGARKDKTLAVRSIERSVRKVRCWDIQTEDHYVYLPEHDVTVSNCDDLVVALGSLMGAYGIPIKVMKQSFGSSDQEHVLIMFDAGGGRWLAADPSAPKSKPIGWRADASKEVVIDPSDPKSIGIIDGPEAEFVGVGKIGFGTTPDDVLAYRQTWDAYVMGVARALATCSAAWANTAVQPSVADLSAVAAPTNATVLKAVADANSQASAEIVAEWNLDALRAQLGENPISPANVVFLAAEILQDMQRVVLKVGQLYAPMVKHYCPSIQLPAPPSFDLQAQVIGRIEGLGILGKGVLQILGMGAGGALETISNLGKKGGDVASTIGDNIPWIAGAVIAVAAAFVVVQVAPFIPKPVAKVGREIRAAERRARRLTSRIRRRRRR